MTKVYAPTEKPGPLMDKDYYRPGGLKGRKRPVEVCRLCDEFGRQIGWRKDWKEQWVMGWIERCAVCGGTKRVRVVKK